ncbi:MAG: hypothetical protein IPL23_15595 [Saprospiraceae bacterium]|nr:hypothetical protein [Saprospiraceae bacterium]
MYSKNHIGSGNTDICGGRGEGSLLKDALVQKDFNGLPIMHGTSLIGVLRHSIEDNLDVLSSEHSIWNNIFGFQKGDQGQGSRLRISSAF